MNLEFRASICEHCNQCRESDCPYDAWVKIVNGRLVQGTIDNNAVGAFKGKILEVIAEQGNIQLREFLEKVNKLSIETINILGFSAGIDEEDIPAEAHKQIKENIEAAELKVEKFIHAYENNELEQAPGRSLEETLELEIMRILGTARDTAGETAAKYLTMDNSCVIMAKSGSRGSMLNLTQMAGIVGQQAVRGERISRGYQGRTLPHFKPGDIGAGAKGFVGTSYKFGLSPVEYFFHSIGGREGLVDTAVRTSRSGYMQRRLINALEDLKVGYDRTVRDAEDKIIQFQYGEDGVNPAKSVYGKAVDVDRIIASYRKR